MKYFKHILIAILWLTASVVPIVAQVDVSMHLDTSQIYIGQQVRLRLMVTAGANDVVVMPEYPDSQLVKGVEVINHHTESIEQTNDGRQRRLIESYVITSFDSAHYKLPAMEATINGKVCASKNQLRFDVYSPEVDTLHLDRFAGPADNFMIVFDWDDIKLPLALWAVGLLVILASIYVAIQIKNNHRILPKLKLHTEGPPHKWAFKQIEKLRHKKPEHTEEAHRYYAELTDILRTYIERRYDYRATAMTSAEIIAQLERRNESRLIDKLRALLESADLVKYAGQNSAIDDSNRALTEAIAYVDATKETEAERRRKTKPQEEPLVKRTRHRRNVLIFLNTLLLIAGVALVVASAIVMYEYC